MDQIKLELVNKRIAFLIPPLHHIIDCMPNAGCTPSNMSNRMHPCSEIMFEREHFSTYSNWVLYGDKIGQFQIWIVAKALYAD